MNDVISKKKLREFGLLIGLVFPTIIGWLLPAITGHGYRAWTLWVGIPSLIAGISAPGLLLYPYKGWMALGHVLGWMNSRIILGLVFLFVLQPIAFVMKFSGYDPLQKRSVRLKSYREVLKNKKTDMTRIF